MRLKLSEGGLRITPGWETDLVFELRGTESRYAVMWWRDYACTPVPHMTSVMRNHRVFIIRRADLVDARAGRDPASKTRSWGWLFSYCTDDGSWESHGSAKVTLGGFTWELELQAASTETRITIPLPEFAGPSCEAEYPVRFDRDVIL